VHFSYYDSPQSLIRLSVSLRTALCAWAVFWLVFTKSFSDDMETMLYATHWTFLSWGIYELVPLFLAHHEIAIRYF